MPPHKDHDGSEKVYEPAEDTALLLRAVQDEIRSADTVLELGCGRGLISAELVSLARSVLATDINPYAVRMTKRTGIETVQADLFRGIKAKFDLIIFNPPYLPTGPQERLDGWLNFAFDGGITGRGTVNCFLEDLKEHLNPEGRAFLLVSSLSGLDEIMKKARKENLKVQECAKEKYFFEELIVLRLSHSSNQNS
ncbi:MAG: HemK2/MTQ2 family protein methyltransferase [Methanotrichaceae archaeon]